MAASDGLLVAKGITKSFPGVLALDDVDFELLAGEVHVLVGHNGAGKSTLIKVISGMYPADKGRVYIEGSPALLDSPASALAAGIATIYQEVNLCSQLSVYENMILGREPITRGRQLARRTAVKWCADHLEQLGIRLNPRTRVGDLPLSQRQLVAIAKSLAAEARVLILDEPTAVLAGPDTERLLSVLRRLRDRGVGIIYVSHRLRELHRIGDRLTVFREGRRIETGMLKDYELDRIVELMVGDKLRDVFPDLDPPSGEIALRIEGIVLQHGARPVDITAHAGEIVGITGLIASGKEKLAQILSGGDGSFVGRIERDGQRLSLESHANAIKAGIGYLSSDRRGEALILQRNAIDNVTLASLHKYCSFEVLRTSRRDAAVKRWMDALDIRGPGVTIPLQLYSGGNQQKVSLAKWLDADSRVLVMVEPTFGLDVGAKKDVYKLIRNLAADGVTLFLISSDLEEVAEMSHRVVVLRDGEIAGEFGPDTARTMDILHRAVVGTKASAGKEG